MMYTYKFNDYPTKHRRKILASANRAIPLHEVPEMKKLIEGYESGKYDLDMLGAIIYESSIAKLDMKKPMSRHITTFWNLREYSYLDNYDEDEETVDAFWIGGDYDTYLVKANYSDKYMIKAIGESIYLDDMLDCDDIDICEEYAAKFLQLPHTCYTDAKYGDMYVFFKQPEMADRLVDELFDEYGSY